MPKRSPKPVLDPNDLEIHPTVAGFEVALRKVAREASGKKMFEIVLRSTDRAKQQFLFLTDKKADATRRLMAFHAGACAMQHINGVQIDRRLG